ncbi:hypothetical protein F5Y01DRAFT_317386 [Xylaria sp. FL0043]|nr:hypothetical protein F5Y01DRAFT_317386 [Xylaria sp. FL0043]
MCYADQHITFFNWVEDHEKPELDFAVHRTCRNYDVLREWFEDKLIPDWRAKTDALRRSPEQKARPQFTGWPEYVKRKKAGYYKDTDWLLGTLDGELPSTCTEKPSPQSH